MTGKKINTFTRLVEVQQLAEDVFLHRYKCPQIAQRANPGQFVMLRVAGGIQPFLPRPFSIAGVDESKQTFSILFNIRGEGTRLLAQKSVGESVHVFGPLGAGFTIDKNIHHHTLIAGGMGIAPLFFLLQDKQS